MLLTGARAHLTPLGPHVDLIASAKIVFPNKAAVTACEVYDLTFLPGTHSSTHSRLESNGKNSFDSASKTKEPILLNEQGV